MALREEKFFNSLHSCIKRARETKISIWLIFSRLQQEKQLQHLGRLPSSRQLLVQIHSHSRIAFLHLIHTPHIHRSTRTKRLTHPSSKTHCNRNSFLPVAIKLYHCSLSNYCLPIDINVTDCSHCEICTMLRAFTEPAGFFAFNLVISHTSTKVFLHLRQ